MKLYKFLFSGVVTEVTVDDVKSDSKITTTNYYFENVIRSEGFMYIDKGIIIDMDYTGEYSSYFNFRNKMLPFMRDSRINDILN